MSTALPSPSGIPSPQMELPSAVASALGLNLNTTIGSLLLGGLVSATLYGITLVQTAIYYQRGQKDNLFFKIIVFALWLLDSFDMCLVCHILYWYFVTNYGNLGSLSNPVWSIILHILVTSLTGVVVRSMFALRIWRISHGNWLLTMAICSLSVLELVCSIVLTVGAFHATFSGLKKMNKLIYLDVSAIIAGDLLVALSLCYLLHISRTGFGKTESIINFLIVYLINTGLLTAITSSVTLMLFAFQPDNFLYIAVYLQLSKLYVNAYLGMLNAREIIRNRMNGQAVSIHLSQLPTSGMSGSSVPSTSLSHVPKCQNKKNSRFSIQVATELDQMTDSRSSMA